MPPDLIPVDYDPFSDAANAFPSFQPAAPASDLPQPLFNDFQVNQGFKPFNKLFGTGGETRHVLWPEQMVRRGADVVHSAWEGNNQLESALVPGAQPVGSQDASYEPNLLGRALGMTEPWTAPGHESGIAKVQDLSGLMAGGPLIERPGTATLGSGMVRTGSDKFYPLEQAGSWFAKGGNSELKVGPFASKAEVDAYIASKGGEGPSSPPFYSAVEAAVRDASQTSMSPEQWRGYLSNRPGVKAEELDWIGMPEGKKVSKQEMLDHLNEHGVQVKEVEKQRGNGVSGLSEDEYYSMLDDRVHEAMSESHPQKRGESDEDYAARTEKARTYTMDDVADQMASEGIHHPDDAEAATGGPKFSEYQLPGGENYREKLFTLPSGEKLHIQAHDTEPGVVQVVGPKGDVRFEGPPEAARQYTQEVNQQSPQNYQSSHWDEPNVLAHVRMNDRSISLEHTPEQKAALAAHESAREELTYLQAEQRRVAEQIRNKAKPLEQQRLAKIDADLKSGQISVPEARRRSEAYEDHLPLNPLQDELTTLRDQENKLRGSLPEKPEQPLLRTLHLEELQSDWHQAGRKQGYRDAPPYDQVTAARDKVSETKQALHDAIADISKKENLGLSLGEVTGAVHDLADTPGHSWHRVFGKDSPGAASDEFQALIKTAQEAKAEHKDLVHRSTSGVPDAPFKTTWPDLVLKRMIREAAENGYDAISWTPGEAQAARYDLSKQIERLHYEPQGNGTYLVGAVDKNGRAVHLNDGKPIPQTKLSDFIGKDVADRIVQDKGTLDTKMYGKDTNIKYLDGVDLKVGGEGMKGFYDKMLVDKANALAKKFGGKVEYKDIGNSMEINEHPKYQEPGSVFKVMSDDPELTGVFASRAEAEAYVKQHSHKVPVLRLTPQMRDTALRKGFPLFASGSPFPLVPVDHDPFKEDK